MVFDYTKAEIDVLIDCIRQDNQSRPLTSAQIAFGVPSVFTPTPQRPRNTTVVGVAIANMGYQGSQTFYYDRVRLIDFVPPGQEELLEFEDGVYTKLSELLPELNDRLKFNLTADKIIEQNLPVFAPNDFRKYADVALMMKPNSLCYLGSLTLRIYRDDIDLVEAIPDADMDGLVYAAPA